MTDPFGTATLREALLIAWKSSPTRLREDAAIESDLVRSGYRDRVFTELAQNAADAARLGGVPGRIAVWVAGDALHVANTGVPLDTTGVQALTAKRASGKSEDGSVGRFGVGFSAVLAVSDDIEIRSSTGSIRFSAAGSRDEVVRAGIESAQAVPVLRLVWPIDAPPATDWSTEVVLRLRDDVDIDRLLESMHAEAADLLLELPALESITIGDARLERISRPGPEGLDEIRIGERVWWQYELQGRRWLVPVVAGEVVAVGHDVLRAPTRSDEELSLPAILVCDIAMQPDRRRVLPGAHVDDLAAGYGRFVAALPAEQRARMVPAAGFARGPVDAVLREAVGRELRSTAWLPVAGDAVAVPTRASVLPNATAELATLLADVIPDLVIPELSGAATASALAQVDVHRIGLARLAEVVSGIEREPGWWHDLYDALDPLVVDAVAVEELGALPVPLADGRTVTGPRTTVAAVDLGGARGIAVGWARLVHPAANHALLGRLGSRQVGAVDLLSDPALEALLEDAADDAVDELADAVLTLADAVAAADQLPSWIGSVLLPAESDGWGHADELLLPDAPLRTVLVDDAPFGTVAPDVVERYGARALRTVGVGWTFTTVREELPTGPDHDLDDEHDWWDTLSEDPPTLVAVRDLDLVAPDRWSAALALLAGDETIRPQFADRTGYLPWWLRNHARVGGQRLGVLRGAADSAFAGLLDVLDHPDSDVLRGCLADPTDIDADLCDVLLERLADPARTPSPAVIVATHRVLGSAAAAERIDVTGVRLPDRVRSVAGTVLDAGDAWVLDKPWLALALPPDRLVAGDIESATALATLLDLPLASESVGGEVLGLGAATSWEHVPFAILAGIGLGIELPVGPVVRHDDLQVRLSGGVEDTVRVPLWVDDAGTTHIGALP